MNNITQWVLDCNPIVEIDAFAFCFFCDKDQGRFGAFENGLDTHETECIYKRVLDEQSSS